MGIFKELGLREIINASGKMTALGASAVDERVAEAMKKASQEYVDINELMEFTSKVIADVAGAEDGCPTIGASAGIAIASAAVIAGTDLSLIERIPDTEGLKNEIIIQKGQMVNFGASIHQMIRLGGGKPIEVGQVNLVKKEHIEQAINENTAALFYVKSHHAVQKGMQPIETMRDIAQKYKLPLIVDAAAEEDFQKYIQLGADIVIYSGGKALEGPTSGFICGKKKFMVACREQYKGIGRPMKVSKEAMAGLITALQLYPNKSMNSELQIKQMTKLCEKLNKVPGLSCRIQQDEAGREIYRAQIQVDQKVTGISAEELLQKLQSQNPAIYLRHHYANIGILSVDPRPLFKRQEDVIASEIIKIIEGEKPSAV